MDKFLDDEGLLDMQVRQADLIEDKVVRTLTKCIKNQYKTQAVLKREWMLNGSKKVEFRWIPSATLLINTLLELEEKSSVRTGEETSWTPETVSGKRYQRSRWLVDGYEPVSCQQHIYKIRHFTSASDALGKLLPVTVHVLQLTFPPQTYKIDNY